MVKAKEQMKDKRIVERKTKLTKQEDKKLQAYIRKHKIPSVAKAIRDILLKKILTIALLFCFLMPCFADEISVVRFLGTNLFLKTDEKPVAGNYGTDGKVLYTFIDNEWKEVKDLKAEETDLKVYKLIK